MEAEKERDVIEIPSKWETRRRNALGAVAILMSSARCVNERRGKVFFRPLPIRESVPPESADRAFTGREPEQAPVGRFPSFGLFFSNEGLRGFDSRSEGSCKHSANPNLKVTMSLFVAILRRDMSRYYLMNS